LKDCFQADRESDLEDLLLTLGAVFLILPSDDLNLVPVIRSITDSRTYRQDDPLPKEIGEFNPKASTVGL
jgi:hypothetical protein